MVKGERGQVASLTAGWAGTSDQSAIYAVLLNSDFTRLTRHFSHREFAFRPFAFACTGIG
jgi:hypothetical protein